MKIRTSRKFDKEIKRLSKKHKSVLEDLRVLTESVIDNPTQGQSLGKNCYKIRMAISS